MDVNNFSSKWPCDTEIKILGSNNGSYCNINITTAIGDSIFSTPFALDTFQSGLFSTDYNQSQISNNCRVILLDYLIQTPYQKSTTNRRGKGSNHVWTTVGDEKLVETMLELKENGKFDGENGSGLRKGYHKEMERILDQKLPGHGLKEKPHTESPCKLLKKQYHAIYDARNSGETCGFGSDNEKKCVPTDVEMWSAYLKSHPDNSFIRNRSFPYYDKLAIIWGQDRVTGKNVEALTDMLENINKEENLDEENEESNEEEGVEPQRDQPIWGNSQGEGSLKKTHRKRKRSADSLVSCLERITEKLTEGLEKSNKQMAKVTESIARSNKKESKNRWKLDEELSKLKFLTQAEHIRARIKLVNDPNHMDYFSLFRMLTKKNI